MRKLSACIVTLFTLFFLFPVPISAFEISAQSGVLIEARTGKVLFSKNENEKRPIASTTKIMTTLLCLESGNLDEQFVVDPEAIKVEGSSMGLIEGDIVTKRALCYGMLLPSGNDAANVTAIKLAGSLEAFSQMMNTRAKQIGMSNTYFVTPSGLDAEGHGSTAYDMALLAREALKNEDFRTICSQSTAKLSYGNPPYDRWLKNSNKLLNYYNGCIGIKTGFTDDAGRCLISAAQRDDVTLICVTLKDPNDWSDHTKMFDYGFSVVKSYDLTVPEEPFIINLVGGYKDYLPVSVAEQPKASLISDEVNRVTNKIIMKKFVYAPVHIGDVVGEIKYYLDNEEIESVPLVLSENADANIITVNPTIFDKIKDFCSMLLDKQ